MTEGMKSLIVHVGMHKTGSTSIQESLAQNLEDPRFEYLRLGHVNGTAIIQHAFDQFLSRRIPSLQGADMSGAELEQRRTSGRKFLGAQMNKLSDRIALLSAEGFSQLTAVDFQDAHRFMSRWRPDITYVGYVRSPKGYVESVFQQVLKRRVPPMLTQPQWISYRRIFEKFDEAVGPDKVQLRKFDPAQFPDKCVVQDFCSHLDIAFDPAKVVRINEGLTLPAIRLLFIYRKFNPFTTSHDANRILAKLFSLKGAKLRFHPNLLGQVLRADPASIEWIEERLGASLDENRGAADDSGLRAFDDLLEVDDDLIDWLGQQTGQPTSRLRGNLQAIANAVRSLGKIRAETSP